MRDLQYEDNYFDLIIDKSTMDALLCGDQSFLNVAIMTKEVQRVLRNGGFYLIISYGQPENRIMHLVHKYFKLRKESIYHLIYQFILSKKIRERTIKKK